MTTSHLRPVRRRYGQRSRQVRKPLAPWPAGQVCWRRPLGTAGRLLPNDLAILPQCL